MSVWESDRLIYVGMFEKRRSVKAHRAPVLWRKPWKKDDKAKHFYMPIVNGHHLLVSAQPWLSFAPDFMVVLPGPWFSHRCVMCGVQTHLLIASTLVLDHGRKWNAWKPLMWDERTRMTFVFWFTNKASFASCSFMLTFTNHGKYLCSRLHVVTPLQVLLIESCRSSEFLWATVSSHFTQWRVSWEWGTPLLHSRSLSAELGGWVDKINLGICKAFKKTQENVILFENFNLSVKNSQQNCMYCLNLLLLQAHTHISWRRKWQPTLAFLHEESHEQRSLVGYSPWVHMESDMTEFT